MQACHKQCPEDFSSNTEINTSKVKVKKPTFDKYLSTTDKDGFSIRVRFKTGGDKESNICATVYWKAYSKKPSTKPTKKDLTKIESMRQYGSATYHNTGSKKGMTESIVFDKSHAGYSGGTYIYYYVECTNSVGSDKSSISQTCHCRSLGSILGCKRKAMRLKPYRGLLTKSTYQGK